MNIKASLTLKFTGIVGAILLSFSVFTYEFSEIFRRNEFTDRLQNVSRNVVVNYLEKEDFTPEILKLMYEKQLNRFPQERLIIADENHEVVFASAHPSDAEITLLKKLYKEGLEFETFTGDTEHIAYILPHKDKNFYVVSSAIDVAGQSKLNFLKYTLGLLNLVCLFLASLLGWYFSRQALQPINRVISEVDAINENNLYQRVSEGSGKDEISRLAYVFNKMLERIEKSFAFQKLFVANAGHEFRTPLTSMKGQIEVTLMQPRTEEEYKKTFESLLDDIQNLISLINGLTDLASANADFPNVTFKEVSILEVMMDAKEELFKRKPGYKIILNWGQFPEEDFLMKTQGDYSLLKSVVINIMDNACKFSPDKQCNVEIYFHKLDIEMQFRDNGPGINEADLPHIFQAFYRSNDTRQVPGYGIGLSLVKKAIELHRGEISVVNGPEKGTLVKIILPNNYVVS